MAAVMASGKRKGMTAIELSAPTLNSMPARETCGGLFFYAEIRKHAIHLVATHAYFTGAEGHFDG